MAGTTKKEVLGYGVRALRARHPDIRKLKRLHSPSTFGFRVWSSSWLLMDFFRHRGLSDGTHVMEVGCGWGLAGIYCAKMHNAVVTGVDIDPDVFPYLKMHSDINKVDVGTLNKGFDGLLAKHLEGVDVMIGADICFWDTIVDSLKSLISRALDEGVQLVVIADPGRETFDRLGEYFAKKPGGVTLDWDVQSPHRIQGKILKIGSPIGRSIGNNGHPDNEMPKVPEVSNSVNEGEKTNFIARVL
jgi:predicted nicotinamide N-methyase